MPPSPVLVVGSGGREHALAWALSKSEGVSEVVVSPGNGGTLWPRSESRASCRRVDVAADDLDGIVALARRLGAVLTVVGPEVPLAMGLVDRLEAAGQRAFGPRAKAAEIEASKAFSKDFMARHGIATARSKSFSDAESARSWVLDLGQPMVVKASGLAAGKGVVVPDSIDDTLAAIDDIFAGRFGDAGATVVVEDRLVGEEVSVLAFTDGRTVSVMPPAQDHKRIGEGDQGANTGGMGAYAPAPCLPDPAAIVRDVLQRTVDGLAAEDRAFQGVLYAGIMLTSQGPKVLEFNCRFGDPETQVLLPLLESDLLQVMLACVDQRLADTPIRWRDGAALTVVAASPGYPSRSTKGLAIQGLDDHTPDTVVFHAGTRTVASGVETAGGRVLAVTGLGADLRVARNLAYDRLERIHFEGMQLRRDIGHRALTGLTYAAAGVSLETGAQVVRGIGDEVASTHGPEVLAGVGSFGGMFSAAALKGMPEPVLVASTDGVGTKTRLATAVGRVDGLGHDLVNHCVNDILVQGARPLFFLDYVASSRLDPDEVVAFVRGCAAACRASGTALLGGETAEMPGVYMPGELDVVGTIVGVVDRSQVIEGRRDIEESDVLIGLLSTGLHTNGYSLARRIIAGLDLTAPREALGESLADALLRPHHCYVPEVTALQDAGVAIHGLAHITGGGLPENLPRVLPEGLAARIDTTSWEPPPIFPWLCETGGVARAESFRAFNMGVGMVVVVAAEQADAALAALARDGLARASVIGRMVPRTGEAVELHE